jgi:hypothetical protein
VMHESIRQTMASYQCMGVTRHYIYISCIMYTRSIVSCSLIIARCYPCCCCCCCWPPTPRQHGTDRAGRIIGPVSKIQIQILDLNIPLKEKTAFWGICTLAMRKIVSDSFNETLLTPPSCQSDRQVLLISMT